MTESLSGLVSFRLNICLVNIGVDQSIVHAVMQSERVCLHSQTISINVAFLLSLLLRFSISLSRNLSLTRFAMLAL